MGQKLFKNNLFILLTLFLVGFIVHIKSFQLVPYGDDWNFIYYYFAHDQRSLHINNLPGSFAYLTPYGPSILTIALTYQFFGKTYSIYYLIPLIFKTLTAFFLFLTLRNISTSYKRNNNFTNFLPAILFMVSMTGIQAIDWAMNTYVYIALFIFTLSLFFQSRYYTNLRNSDMVLSFFLAVSSIIFAPTRFTPFVLILPLIDLVMIISKKNNSFASMVILKNIIFALLSFIFLKIGIFGEPGQLNNTGRIQEFINGASADLHFSFVIFMHWVGITILPTFPSSNINITAITGALLLGLLIQAFYKSRNEWLIIAGLIFLTTLGIMWIITPLKVADSAERFLVVPFFGLCFLIGLLFLFLDKLKKFLIIIVLFLFALQIYSVNRIYSYWISVGRGRDFMIPVEQTIMKHFPNPISEPKYIFLDFDDGAVQQSVVFGLGFRVAFLSGTRNTNLIPKSFSDKDTLMEVIDREIKIGEPKERIINNISAFRLRNKEFVDITSVFQEELRREI